ncbi:MAG TPA: choice-of-anchor J domain-containing protein, partial [Salinivirgaceae bacterium]|nr:choice-of-anchor J domain-containing protein [Salinivirgaceae bacterium]
GESMKNTATSANNRGLSPWVERNITLPTGTKYVAFRHYNSYNNNYLYVDDVTISGDPSTGNYSFTITKNGAEIATGVTETAYTDTDVANGTYEYCVKVVYSDCTSEPACAAPVTVYNPANNVQAIVEGANVNITWDAPTKDSEILLTRDYTYTITRDGDVIATGITETAYTDIDVVNGTYVYCVKVIYPDYTSDLACAAPVIVLNCDPATNVQAVANGSTVYLSWDAPTDAGGDNNITITYGFEGDIEAEGWDIHSFNTSDTWRQVGTIEYPSGNVYPHEGSFQMQCHWDNADQNEWLISPRFALPAQADLTFWTYLTCGSTYGDHYYVKISIDNGFSWTELWDASTQPAGANHYDEAINISLAEYANQNIKLAWHALATGGLYYAWFVDDITISGVASEDYTYTVTRDGVEIANGLTETNYTDENVPSGTHNYCVEVVYNTCTSMPACATLVGIEDDSFNKIKIYPNPAKDNLTIECAENINEIEVFDVLGKKLMSNENILNKTNIDISSLNNGVYFLIVHTANGNGEYKIIKQ